LKQEDGMATCILHKNRNPEKASFQLELVIGKAGSMGF
jgi:hypothetical protein